jgi:hypothetical protein
LREKREKTNQKQNEEWILLEFPLTFVFELGSSGILMSEGNQLPGAILQRALQYIGVLVIPEHAEIAGLFAVPSVDACFYLNDAAS